MRDDHEGMPELIDAFEKDGGYFGIVGAKDGEKERDFQFSLSLQGYRALKKVMQDRPFDLMPGLRYRYFYADSSKSHPEDRYTMIVNIELD